MTDDRRARLREVFHQVMQRDPEEREAFLDQVCADSPDVRAEVESLMGRDVRQDRGANASGDPLGPPAGEGDLQAGSVVGPYIIRHEIGRGGMGVVYLADDTRLSRRVALKALVPGLNREAGHRERMRQEARAAAALSHPGIATVFAFEEIGEELYLVCEYVPGQTLRMLLESGPLPLRQVVDVATQLARALAAAHGQGVVHRDLKPENVIRTPTGVVKILDFGLARVENPTQTRLTETGTVLGTPAYMSPEQAMGREVDFRTDVFSLGILVYEMSSGTNPFETGNLASTIARILEADVATLSQVSPSGLPQLDRIVATCLRKEPAERYKSTVQLQTDLEQAQAHLSGAGFKVKTRRPQAEDSTGRSSTLTARWWWEFHQLAVSVFYVLMVYPVWRVRGWLLPPWGMVLLFVVLTCVAVATTLRLHLRFTARVYPAEFAWQRAHVLPWTRMADAGCAVALAAGAFAIGTPHPEFALLLAASGIVAAVLAFLIEPATTRAAFAAKSRSTRSSVRRRRTPAASRSEPPAKVENG